ncbi:hypothetical protein AB0M43_27940 [Longispora sp. NPDC051575]|uniref:hypothetical protein n=1 Tax=Longispora sp. NPDC051575 TaxID=3154943 RepID=UPI0034193CDA
MRLKRIGATMAVLTVGAAGLLGGSVTSAQADTNSNSLYGYYCSWGPNTTDNNSRADAECKSVGTQAQIVADCDWSPWNIYSNTFNSNLEYRKTNGSCWYGVISAWIGNA